MESTVAPNSPTASPPRSSFHARSLLLSSVRSFRSSSAGTLFLPFLSLVFLQRLTVDRRNSDVFDDRILLYFAIATRLHTIAITLTAARRRSTERRISCLSSFISFEDPLRYPLRLSRCIGTLSPLRAERRTISLRGEGVSINRERRCACTTTTAAATTTTARSVGWNNDPLLFILFSPR